MSATSPSVSDGPITVLAIPESARAQSFCHAARATGLATKVTSWNEYLTREGFAATPVALRLESPGRNWATEARLLALGYREPDESSNPDVTRIAPDEIARLGEPAGRIIAMRQWYLGWRAVLDGIANAFPNTDFFSAPKSVATLFDKEACQHSLDAGGCAMPPSLGIPSNFEDLHERMRAGRVARVFLKMCHGSSASGVLALESSRGQFRAHTTTRLTTKDGNVTLWNIRPPKTYDALPEIVGLVDAICRHRAQAQVWVPKMGWRDHRIDLRIVTIAGCAAHAVLRMSKSPFTNLQLRNRRGDLEQFAREHPQAYARARTEAEKAAACFPACLSLGIDVAITPSGKAVVLEANAFGDYLPDCLYGGADTYEVQINAWLTSRRAARSRPGYQTPPSTRPPDGRSSS